MILSMDPTLFEFTVSDFELFKAKVMEAYALVQSKPTAIVIVPGAVGSAIVKPSATTNRVPLFDASSISL